MDNPPVNRSGQPVGEPLPDWSPPPRPVRQTIEGKLCCLVPLEVESHARKLYEANSLDSDGLSWTYLPYGPFDSFDAYQEWVAGSSSSVDPLFYAIEKRASGDPVGVASYLRIDPAAGSIEVGHLHFSPAMARSAVATEAMYLMMRYAFELGYRRYEWKCDSLNAASRRAAERLGFVFEGVWRQAAVYKDRSRDTAWYSVLDREWPQVRETLERWLAPSNFDPDGQQRSRLSEQMTAARSH